MPAGADAGGVPVKSVRSWHEVQTSSDGFLRQFAASLPLVTEYSSWHLVQFSMTPGKPTFHHVSGLSPLKVTGLYP